MKKAPNYVLFLRNLILMIGVFIIVPRFVFADTNLIANPYLELATVSSSTPDGWHTGGYGTSTSIFTYPVLGPSATSSVAANINVSNYSSGDAKWYFTPVAVTAGSDYQFSDLYTSTSTTELVADFFDASNTQLSFDGPISLSATPPNTWQTGTAKFSAPVGAAYMTVFHLLASNGSLTTDNYNLIEVPPAPPFGNGVVTLAFDDGWRSQYKYAYPIMKAAGYHGSFYIITNTLPGDPEDVSILCDDPTLNYCDGATIATTTTSWIASDQFPDPNQNTYTFSDSYIASATSTVEVSYLNPDGTAIPSQQNIVIATLPPVATVQQTNVALVIPQSVMSLISTSTSPSSPSFTISQTVSVGETQQVTNPTLLEAESPVDTYMNSGEILDLQSNGNEIGAHTIDHCDLSMLDANPDSATTTACASMLPASSTPIEQIDGSRSALLALGATPVDTFAYPYGGFDANVEQLVKADGFIAARTVLAGYNTKDSDMYALNTQLIDQDITLDPNGLATAESWIDEALAGKKWLILTMHGVFPSNIWDENVALDPTSTTDATKAEFFQSIINYLKSKNACVATMHDAATALNNSTDPCSVVTPPPVNQAPVIAPHTDVSVVTTSSSGTTVIYTLPTVTDDTDVGIIPTCAPSSGSNFAIGTTIVTCNAIDSQGAHATSTTFNIIVTLTVIPDTTPPVITLNGASVVNLTVGDTYTELGATATDNVDGTDTVVVGGDTVNTSVVGTYTIKYDAQDAAGNHAIEVTRTVNVNAAPVPPDTIAPVITLLGNVTVNINVGDTYVDAGATATDNKDGDITANIVTTNGVNSAIAGIYFVNYNVSDAAGNPAIKVTRTVNVNPVVVLGGGGGGGTPIVIPPVVPNVVDTISPIPGGTPHPIVTQGQVLGSSVYVFTLNIGLGSTGDEVTELQQRLTAEGEYTGPITGYFGPLTKAAVKAYQTKNGLPVTGYVGPMTRSKLNADTAPTVSTTTTDNDTVIAGIMKQIADLESQLKNMGTL